MRTSNRRKILDAIIAIVERDGITAVTFDAAAAETGPMRGGLLYHFRRGSALIPRGPPTSCRPMEAGMEKIASGKADTVRAGRTRCGLYPELRADGPPRRTSDDAGKAGEPDLDSLWQGVLDRWSPPVPDDDDPAALARFVARLCADGLRVHEAMSNRPLPGQARRSVSVVSW